MSNIKRNIIQYVYHFEYPMNSIDVRTITDEQLKTCREIIDFYDASIDEGEIMYLPQSGTFGNYHRIKKMLTEHFPEELI